VLAVEASLVAAGFKVSRDSVAGRRAVIARSTRLGRGPLGSWRHVVVLIAVFKAGMAGGEHLDRFSDEAAQYAATVKGGPPSGVSVVAVAVVESIEGPQEREWGLSGRAGTFTVLVDLGAARVVCPDSPAYRRRLVQDHVAVIVGAKG